MSYCLENPYLKNYWNCVFCNYHNKNTRNRCFRCQTIKQTRNLGDWNCLMCDRILSVNLDRCLQCNITRDGVPIPEYSSNSSNSNNLNEEEITVEQTELAEPTESSDPSSQLCTICLTNQKNSIFLHGSTAHQGACYECATRCNNVCPLCRQRVDRVVKLY